MKIMLTGGGSGGHFYPLMAVAEKIYDISQEKKILRPLIYFASDDLYNQRLLFELDIEFVKISATKVNNSNFIFKIFTYIKLIKSIISTTWKMFWIYPDVVFTNGNYSSVPVSIASRILGIPVFVHISDVVPSRANGLALRFAEKISLSFPETIDLIPENQKKNTAYTGNPIRKNLLIPQREGAEEFLNLENNIQTIFVVGGSQGAQNINDNLIDALPRLLEKYQVIHQTGEANFNDMEGRASVVLEKHPYKSRYHNFKYLNELSMRMVAGVSDLVVSRSGGGAISEIAVWGIPSILIPIPKEVNPDQRKNAYSYARSTKAVVVEQNNLSPFLLYSEIDRILSNQFLLEEMRQGTLKFAKKDAADKIAQEIIETGLKHEI